MRVAAEKAEPEPFPWDAVIAFGIGVLRLDPAAFWRLTPAELAAIHRGLAGRADISAHPAHADLAELMQAFPDL